MPEASSHESIVPDEGLLSSPQAENFASALDEILMPQFPAYLSDGILEEVVIEYDKAYTAATRSKEDKSETWENLVETLEDAEENVVTQYPEQLTWRIKLMAKCYLLLATFTNYKWITEELMKWETEAGIAAKFNWKLRRATPEEEQNELLDLKRVCREVRLRIHAGPSRSREEKEEKGKKGVLRSSVRRVTVEWLAETDKAVEDGFK
ncbi:MAG: hypothetical protein Q9170_007198 [Blastenia crenularia]